MPGVTDITARVAPYAREVLADDDLREHLGRAAAAARGARLRRRPAPKPTRLQRAGTALRESGQALVALGGVAEKRRRQRRRTVTLGTALAGGAATAAAVALRRRSAALAGRSPSPTAQENAHG